MRRGQQPGPEKSSDIQQRFNDHRQSCRACFTHCISSLHEAAHLCDYGRQLQAFWAPLWKLEEPKS